MKLKTFFHSCGTMRQLAVTAMMVVTALFSAIAANAVTLADKPVFAGADVPGNLMLALSVEFPTAISVANIGNYNDAQSYLGYFDPAKCYNYNYIALAPTTSYFQPSAFATGTNAHSCSGAWSGNFMNWASMQTIDPFRWALSGGYRSVDTISQTILEKAWGSAQGSAGSNFNYRGTSFGYPNQLTVSVSSVTPFSSWGNFNTGIWANGNAMVFSQGNGYGVNAASAIDLSSVALANAEPSWLVDTPFRVYIRVDVCDATTALGTSGLESNCVQYPASPSPGPYHYKPEGLMQQHSQKVRYSTFSYLNTYGSVRQGGVMRAPMGFIGPTYPQPLSSPVTNPRAEWDATTGIMGSNPDTASSSASGVSESGAMNFLNKFGEYSKNYMTYDNVSELYYAAVRYYENLGNVPEWTNGATTTELDGFPAVTTWTDPISYSCQQNFILGIGDDHTWFDYNVGGDTNASGSRPMPAAVAADTFNMASSWTTSLQTLEGMSLNPYIPFDSGATDFIAGLAYGVHVNDIRPDLPNSQTISTFWMDVEEGGGAENLNQYYLAAKYGGFTVPTSYTIGTAFATSTYDPSNGTIPMNGGNTHYAPNNYFLAGSASAMVAGLTSAFTSIVSSVNSHTTSFSFSSANVSSAGTESFATQYDPKLWTGTLTGSQLSFDSMGNPTTTQLWTSDSTLQSQLAGTGWKTNRLVATWNGSTGAPFEAVNLTASQVSALNRPSYSTTMTCVSSASPGSCSYLDYLRGDQSNEVGSTAMPSTQSLRARTLFLGDVVNASLTPVANPIQTYSQANNPGYPAFKAAHASRATMVYAAANDGMLHGFVGLTGAEQFAYVPSDVYQGPTGTPQINGLAAYGNPSFTHHYYVDATPVNFDIDLNHTFGSTSTSTSTSCGASSSGPNWRTLLIGGLGKGGKSYYAIDVTDPVNLMTSESAVAQCVNWEFTDPTMGYSFGGPVVVKTAKYGWVAAFTSGYNNSDGYGYIYFVNPANGTLLEKVRTPTPSSGLTQASAYVQDYSDDTADSIYVGDLNGQVWRFDLTQPLGTSTPYPAPTLFALLTDTGGVPQPVTSAPLIEIHPTTRLRYVMIGTGRLLDTSDVSSGQQQTFTPYSTAPQATFFQCLRRSRAA